MSPAELKALLRNNPDLAVEGLRCVRPEPERAKAYRLAHPPAPTEEEEQIQVMIWAELACSIDDYPELAMLYHIPNGGWRDKRTAHALKRIGVKAGVPDLHLPVARHSYTGLWIELKRADRSNHPTPEQEWWIEQLRASGARVVVCYGAEEAITVIEEYLK